MTACFFTHKRPTTPRARPMNPHSLRVNLAERSYDIVITAGAVSQVGALARPRTKAQKALIVTDVNAKVHALPIQQSLAAAGFRAALAIRPSGEAQKSLASAAELYDA